MHGVVLHAHPVRGDLHNERNTTGEVATVSKPNYEPTTIFDENTVGVHMKTTVIFFNKPVYLGMSILDLSKTLMYDFHYNYMRQKYAEICKSLNTDTDSLMYEITTDYFYRDISDSI